MTGVQKFSGTSATASQACPHCGLIHQTTCPRIKAIEYEHGMIKRIEFHAPQERSGWDLLSRPNT